MKSVNIAKEDYRLSDIFSIARIEPVLLLANGEEFIISRADNFEIEVETLRSSSKFQAFLDERIKCRVRYTIEELEKEIDEEIETSKA